MKMEASKVSTELLFDQEWLELLLTAKGMGISIEEIRTFLSSSKERDE